MPKKQNPPSQPPSTTVVINLPRGYHPDVMQVIQTLTDPGPKVSLPIDLADVLRQFEWLCIDQALAQTRGNRQKAAELLGMNRTTLVEKLRRTRKTGPIPPCPKDRKSEEEE
jgi:sigma-54 specific flagellar transcriptional regulator A